MYLHFSPSHRHHSGSSGNVSFTDLAPGKYVLRVAATNSREDRAIERRRFEISSDPSFCTTHLINEGVTVSGDTATVEFAGIGPAETFRCKLDTEPAFACKLNDLLFVYDIAYPIVGHRDQTVPTLESSRKRNDSSTGHGYQPLKLISCLSYKGQKVLCKAI